MKTVLVYSGGMDSTTLLYELLHQGDEVMCLSFDYSQRHKKELVAAKKICAALRAALVGKAGHAGRGKRINGALAHARGRVTHKIVDITAMKSLMAGSALTSPEVPVPEGHYADATMKATVVPNRNMIFLSLAIAQAVSWGARRVAIAVHAGDHAIYPDCRPAFIKAMNAVSKIANYEPVQIHAPFLNMTKGDIAKIGAARAVPFEKTWTCYKGLAKPCGTCGACVERAEALAGL